jgi:Xaa-Pro aminopeptidase
MKKNIITDRIEKLRNFMREKGYNAFIVVSSDPHSSEYVADCWGSFHTGTDYGVFTTVFDE